MMCISGAMFALSYYEAVGGSDAYAQWYVYEFTDANFYEFWPISTELQMQILCSNIKWNEAHSLLI